MRKLVAGLFMCSGLLVQVARASMITDYALDVKEATGKYALSYLAVSYYDHFHEDAPAEKNILVSVPLLNLGLFGIDPFATFDGNYIREAGVRLPILALKKIRLDPWVFRNYEVDSYGWGISAVVRLR